jgi:hypothetical protein
VIIFVFSAFMVGCASSVTLEIAYHPAKVDQSRLAGFPARRIQLGNFSDPGGGTTFIGQRKAAFEAPMGNVFATRQPGVVVRDAVAAELRRNGHTLVDTNPDAIVRGRVETFWIRTDVTPVYWDVLGDVRFSLEFLDSSLSKIVFKGTYGGHDVERTYLWPSEDIMKQVLENALTAAILQMSSDDNFLQALR